MRDVSVQPGDPKWTDLFGMDPDYGKPDPAGMAYLLEVELEAWMRYYQQTHDRTPTMRETDAWTQGFWRGRETA